VSGLGHYSGRSYSFGENGPETVTPGVPGGASAIALQLYREALTDLLDGRVVNVLTGVVTRQRGNP
jgi:hypothetical protein